MAKFEQYNERHHGDVNSAFRNDRRDSFMSGLVFLIIASILLSAAIVMFSLNDFNFGLTGTNTMNPFTGIGYFLLFAFFFPGIPALLVFPRGIKYRKILRRKDNWMVTTARFIATKRFPSAKEYNDELNNSRASFFNIFIRYEYQDGRGNRRVAKFASKEIGKAGEEIYLAISNKAVIPLATKASIDNSNAKPKKKTSTKNAATPNNQSISDELSFMRHYLSEIKQLGLDKSDITPLKNESPTETLARDIRNTELFILHLEMKSGNDESRNKLVGMAKTCKDAEYYLNADIL